MTPGYEELTKSLCLFRPQSSFSRTSGGGSGCSPWSFFSSTPMLFKILDRDLPQCLPCIAFLGDIISNCKSYSHWTLRKERGQNVPVRSCARGLPYREVSGTQCIVLVASSAWGLLRKWTETSPGSTGRLIALGNRQRGPGDQRESTQLFRGGESISYISHTTASHSLLCAR